MLTVFRPCPTYIIDTIVVVLPVLLPKPKCLRHHRTWRQSRNMRNNRSTRRCSTTCAGCRSRSGTPTGGRTLWRRRGVKRRRELDLKVQVSVQAHHPVLRRLHFDDVE